MPKKRRAKTTKIHSITSKQLGGLLAPTLAKIESNVNGRLELAVGQFDRTAQQAELTRMSLDKLRIEFDEFRQGMNVTRVSVGASVNAILHSLAALTEISTPRIDELKRAEEENYAKSP